MNGALLATEGSVETYGDAESKIRVVLPIQKPHNPEVRR